MSQELTRDFGCFSIGVNFVPECVPEFCIIDINYTQPNLSFVSVTEIPLVSIVLLKDL